jgi:hypothetical protein
MLQGVAAALREHNRGPLLAAGGYKTKLYLLQLTTLPTQVIFTADTKQNFNSSSG